MRKLIFFFLILFNVIVHSTNVNAQAPSRVGIYVGGGATWYYGDMNDRIITNSKLFRSYFNAGILFRALPKFDILLNYTTGKIVGADSLAIQTFNITRDLNFESKISEISLMLNYRFLRNGYYGNKKINPYIIAGIGYLKFNPQSTFNGQKIDLQPLGTEGQFISNRGTPAPYKLYTLSIPLGIGVEIPLSNAFYLRLEYANHFTFTDYIDDISTKYTDSTALANTPNGALAVEMSNNIAKGYPKEGYGRGNPKQRDSFSTFGISILYTPILTHGNGNSGGSKNRGVIGKKKKHKKGCPAYN